MQKTKLNSATDGRPTQIVYSTTDGRQRFPDILQVSYGEKAVIGFDRYGRALGAVVPMEAVLMLAGKTAAVDEDVRARIERAALRLLSTVGGSDEAIDLDLVDAERKAAPRNASTSPPAKRKSGG